MILLNFSHPLTDMQLEQLATFLEGETPEVVHVPLHLEDHQPFGDQIMAVLDAPPASQVEWETDAIVVMLPGLSSAAAVLLAELHGRCGYFPPVVRRSPKEGAVPPRFEIVELLDLQTQRHAARRRRETKHDTR